MMSTAPYSEKSPLVTIIVPVYNVKSYLEECFSSIASQSYANLEVILVDDGSSDGSEHICDELAAQDKRVKVIHQPNGGLSAARNSGLDIATGVYLLFVDSDDAIHPQMVSLLVSLALEHKASCVMAQCFRFEYDSKPKFDVTLSRDAVVLRGTAGLEYVLKDRTHIGVTAKLFDRLSFGDIRFVIGEINEDLVPTTLCLSRLNSCVGLDAPLYAYRRNRPGSITGSLFSERHFCVAQHLEDMLAIVQKTAPELNMAARYLCLITSLDMANIAASSYFVSACARKGYGIFGKLFRKNFYPSFLIDTPSSGTKLKTLLLLSRILSPLAFSMKKVLLSK